MKTIWQSKKADITGKTTSDVSLKVQKCHLLRGTQRSLTISSYLFMAPFMVSFFIFTVLPVLASVCLSFTDFNMVSAPTFAGLNNYIRMLLDDDVLLKSVQTTLVFAVLTGPVSYFMCLLLAWLVNETNRFMRVLFTAVFYIPSTVTSAIGIFSYIFSGDSYGLVNSVLMRLGIIQDPIYWLTDDTYNLWVIILIQLWLSLGAGFLSFVAGFQSIDPTLYESGAIDGIRNRFQELYYLTLPCMRPQLMFGAVMQITASFSVSAVPITLTGFPSTNDSTTTVITHVLDISTLRMEMGYACAIATVLFLVMLLTRNIISLIIKSD